MVRGVAAASLVTSAVARSPDSGEAKSSRVPYAGAGMSVITFTVAVGGDGRNRIAGGRVVSVPAGMIPKDNRFGNAISQE
ncbi:hypothetical protein GCM10023223_35120 [Stackebrandtia albiflava]